MSVPSLLSPVRVARVMLTAAAAVLVASCGEGSTEPPAPKLFETVVVFGGSLDDTGNACNALPIACPPYPYANARYSNGPLWVEQMAEVLNARVVAARGGGTNYAFATSRTGPITGTTQAAPNMIQQVDLYIENGSKDFRDVTLYVIDAATVGNDIVDALTLGLTNPQAPATVLAGAVTNVATMVSKLYAAGARHILLVNSTDVGRTPQVVALGPLATTTATTLSQQFNAAVSAQLPALRTASPGLTIYPVDIGALTAQVAANPSSFGFTNVSAACVSLSPPSLCGSPTTYFYWDGFHPTQATGKLVSQRALAALGR
jgi:phospholipase/lecithinase/hemolysin